MENTVTEKPPSQQANTDSSYFSTKKSVTLSLPAARFHVIQLACRKSLSADKQAQNAQRNTT